MNLVEFRTEYPQYDDLPDEVLVKSLHSRHYSDIDFADFSGQIGYQPVVAAPAPDPVVVERRNMFTRLATAAGEKLQALTGVGRRIGSQLADGVDLQPIDIGPTEGPQAAGIDITQASRPEGIRPVDGAIPDGVGPIPPDSISTLTSRPVGETTEPVSLQDVVEQGKIVGMNTAEIAAGILELPAAVLSGMTAATGGGLAGLGQLVAGQGKEKALESIERAISTFSYQPRTKAGQELLISSMVPFEQLNALAQAAGDKSLELFPDQPGLAAGVYTAIDTFPIWTPYAWAKIKPRIVKSHFYRNLTIPERGMMLQAAEQAFKEGKISEGQLIRRERAAGRPERFETARKARGDGEVPDIQPEKIKPVKIPPEKPVAIEPATRLPAEAVKAPTVQAPPVIAPVIPEVGDVIEVAETKVRYDGMDSEGQHQITMQSGPAQGGTFLLETFDPEAVEGKVQAENKKWSDAAAAREKREAEAPKEPYWVTSEIGQNQHVLHEPGGAAETAVGSIFGEEPGVTALQGIINEKDLGTFKTTAEARAAVENATGFKVPVEAKEKAPVLTTAEKIAIEKPEVIKPPPGPEPVKVVEVAPFEIIGKETPVKRTKAVKDAMLAAIEIEIKTAPDTVKGEVDIIRFIDPAGAVFNIKHRRMELMAFHKRYKKAITAPKKKVPLFKPTGAKPTKPQEEWNLGEGRAYNPEGGIMKFKGGWISDGHVAIKSEPPKGKPVSKKHDLSPDYIKKMFIDEKAEPAELRYYTTPGKAETLDEVVGVSKTPVKLTGLEAQGPVAVFKVGDKRIGFFQDKLNIITNRYPAATFKYHENKLFAYDGGKLVGLLMAARDLELNAAMAKTAGYYSVGDYAEIPAIIELPELVQLAKDLLGGKYPKLVKRFRQAGVRGVFRPSGNGTIAMRLDLAKDLHQALLTLSHEIGHLVDWLPDKSMAKGNILGRIAGLKNYRKHLLPFSPYPTTEGSLPGLITKQELNALRREARRLSQAAGEKWIDEMISKETPVSPDDVLAILKGLKLDQELDPELVHFVFTAGTKLKKAMALQAMKGLSPVELSHLKAVVLEPTGIKIQIGKPDARKIYKKFKSLVKEEIRRRRLFQLAEIADELKSLTEVWRPFVPYADLKYTKYRYSAPELYADAISAFITNAKLLKRIAPTFYEAFVNYVDSKPEFKENFDAIQALIKRGPQAVSENRIQGDYEMFARGHQLRKEALEKVRGAGERIFDTLGRGLWDRNHSILKELRRLENKGGKVGERARRSRWDLEEIEYIASEVDDYVREFNKNVQLPADEAGISIDDIGVYLLRKHIEKNREGIFSPKGYTSETVQQDLQALENKWGKERFDKVVRFAEEYRKLREKQLIPLLKKSGLLTLELEKIIEDRIYYSKVSVLKYLEDKFGGGTAARIYKQFGTLEEVENPLVATMLQDISMFRAARINLAKASLVESMQEAGVIMPAETKYSQDIKAMKPVRPPDPNIDIFTVMVDGRPKHYYVSKSIVDTFKFSPFEAMQMTQVWNYLSQPIRDILVSKNPIWQVRNIIRDFRETYKKIPEIKIRHLPRLAGAYKKAWGEVWREVMKNDRSPDIKRMMQSRMLLADRVWSSREMNFDDELQRIVSSFGLSTEADKQAGLAKRTLRKFFRTLDKTGRASEIWGKVAGYKYLMEYTDRDLQNIGHLVRSRIGTPDVKRKGAWQLTTNNMFMFSNVSKEGQRANYESFREDPGAYIWKTIATNFIPKMILSSAAAGALGWYWKEVVDQISEYDKAHYTVVPLYKTKNFGTAYLRIPEDYEGQFFGALMWKLLNMKVTGPGGAVSEISQQNPYQWHPLIEIGTKLADYYLRGQNPVDDFRGRYILTDRVYEAGGYEAFKELGKYAWKNLGLSVVYNPSYRDLELQESRVQKVLKTFPGNILGTFLKISDQGMYEQLIEQFKILRKQKAKATLKLDAVLMKMTPAEKLMAYEAGIPRIKRKVRNILLREKNTAYSRALASARTREEMELVMEQMLKFQRLVEDEE